MLQTYLDNNKLEVDFAGGSLSELLNEIRQFIPLHLIIIQVKINGEELREESWDVSISIDTDTLLEVETAEKYKYLTHRLQLAATYLQQILSEFSQASTDFSIDRIDLGKFALATAVDNFLAFVHWYLTVLALDRPTLSDVLVQFRGHVVSIQVVCEEMLSQQIFENNLLVGEILRTKLIPEIERLQNYCKEVSLSYSQGHSAK